jgi:predicted dehydrogenase
MDPLSRPDSNHQFLTLMKDTPANQNLDRRDFLKGGSFATLMMMMGAVELKAQAQPAGGEPEKKYSGDPVSLGLIGCGVQGRESLKALSVLPAAKVVAVCDHYEPMLKRAKASAPKAEAYADYKQLLANAEVKAVIVATPSHLHKQIVLDALAAGKHVYCEAPLAHTVEDARIIALAAKQAVKQVFQGGLPLRSNPQHLFLLNFIRTGAAGKNVKARAQWHKKASWRQASANPERERAMNWRLRRETSPGLVGEVGIHQIDLLNWFMNARPVAVTGFGSTVMWNDGRDVPDNIQAVFEYPDGALLSYEATLANSFDADHELLKGADSTVMLRQNKAWLFKEVDAPLLGWEVYARKDVFYKETGIALVANATKAVKDPNKPEDPDGGYTEPPLQFALESFLINAANIGNAVEDFNSAFDPKDTAALAKYLAAIKRQPATGFKESYEATVIALKANEAVNGNKRVALDKELFDLV